MNKEDLRHILQQPYQPEDWRKVFDFVFPNVSYLKSPQPIPFSNEKVESFKQLGAVRLNDGKNLAIFEVKVAPNVNIPRNRVELRNLVAPLIDQDRNHGVLVIYEQGSEDYRFTFTAKETVFDEGKVDFVNRETESKRFTYVLGSNEPCRTAGDRFWELSTKKDSATLQDIEEAFSVDRLNDEFFPKYKQHYQAFVDYLTGSHFKASAFNGDEKRIRDFVKVLLGRIVFLQFVQKKRWLGASDANYTDGDKNFLQHFWNRSGKNESFYYAHLSRLFFEALNKNERPGQLFEMPDGGRLCVPFLGGGLFEKDRNEPDLLTFPPALFDGLFNFFAEYNFTIDENDPFENEVGIDPEMLGHIFENLLEDNKDKGAFYTPKPIVKYMCQESLIQYLLTQLEQFEVFAADSELKVSFEERVGRFVKKYEAHDLIDYDNILAKALHTVKVCDPAIGSGAFPMGILNEMVMLINVLHNASPDVVEDIWQMENWQPATVKRHVIQNSIYGVDIEKGAVDIARLRFWLSLILDEEKPNALPSLDYKIVVGNSLVSKFENEIVEIDWQVINEQTDLFGNENLQRRKELLLNISKKQSAYFQIENQNKEGLKLEIRNLKIDILINQLELMIKSNGIETQPYQSNFKDKKKFSQAYQLYIQTQGWKKLITHLKAIKEDPNKVFVHFDWSLDFPEVLNPFLNKDESKLGFDIVIANPPYVDSENMAINSPDLREYLRLTYLTTKGNWDLFVPFIELGLNLNISKGVFTYIIPNKMLSASYTTELRTFLSNNNILEIRDYSRINVFKEANVYPVTIFIKKQQKKSDVIMTTMNSIEVVKSSNLISSISFYGDLFWDKYFFEEKYVRILFKLSQLSNFGMQVDFNILGAATVNEAYLIKERLQDNYKSIDAKKFINTGTIDKWTSLWGIKKTQYIKQSYQYPTIADFEIEKINSNRYAQAQSPKIIIAGMSNEIEAFLDINGEYIAGKSTTIIIDNLWNLKIYCALLNSKLASFFVNYNYHSLKMSGGYLNINNEILSNIPYPQLIVENEIRIIEMVDKLLQKINIGEEKFNLTKQLDSIIFRIYNLKYDEVKVIDSEFDLSQEEYEKISLT